MLRPVKETAMCCCGCAGVAFVPYAMYVLSAAPLLGALGTAVSMSFVVLVPLVITDWLFYGRWTVRSLHSCPFLKVMSSIQGSLHVKR